MPALFLKEKYCIILIFVILYKDVSVYTRTCMICREDHLEAYRMEDKNLEERLDKVLWAVDRKSDKEKKAAAQAAERAQAVEKTEPAVKPARHKQDVPKAPTPKDPEDEISDEQPDAPKKKKRKKRYIVLAVIAVFFVSAYLTFVYSDIPFIKYWRTIYIETAMSTNSHQWLATWFIPKSVIDEVMAEKEAAFAAQRGLESRWDDGAASGSAATPVPTPTPVVVDPRDEFFEKYWELDSKSFRKYLDKKSIDTKQELDNLKIDNLDGSLNIKTKKKDKVLVCDIKNSLIIVGVEGSSYVGKLAIVKDPSLVCVGKASHLPSRGDIIDEFGENYNAVLAINASGFVDKGGHGSGGAIRGSLVIDGVDYSQPEGGDFKFFGMRKKNNRFYIESPWKVNVKKYRWGVQFFPALVVDGKCVVAGTYGLGIQPRTTVGQAKDGSFLMLIVDGRQIGYSLGCTMEECANQLIKYKVYQAANLDGGSSSIMWYNGRQITKSSSPSGIGRYLPDALYVKKVR